MNVQRIIKVAQRALDGTVVEYSTRWKYDVDRPFEVVVSFMPPGQKPTDWVFSREALLLACFASEPPEAGDIRMYSCIPGQVVHVDLYGQFGGGPWHASVHVAYKHVQEFLKDVALLLPAQDMALPADAVDELILAINDWSDSSEQ